jgi:predicted RNA-binding Zn-ribbon protein involved in translation (DUF1610 family)
MAKICKKCGYERQLLDTAPEYECPKCKAIYAKVEEYLEKKKLEEEKAKTAIYCEKCGNEISKQSGSCLKCKDKDKNKSNKNKKANNLSGGQILIGLISGIVAIWWLASSNLDKKTTFVFNSQKNISLDSVASEELYKIYEENEINADLKYKGKQIKIIGKVSNIAKDITNKSYVSLGVKGNAVFGIQCFLSQDSLSQAAELKKGQDTILSGRVDGKFGNIIIRDCSVQ